MRTLCVQAISRIGMKAQVNVLQPKHKLGLHGDDLAAIGEVKIATRCRKQADSCLSC